MFNSDEKGFEISMDYFETCQVWVNMWSFQRKDHDTGKKKSLEFDSELIWITVKQFKVSLEERQRSLNTIAGKEEQNALTTLTDTWLWREQVPSY